MSDIPEDVEMDLDEPDSDSDEESEGWPGATRTWTTPAQWAWLKRTRPPYLAAKKIKRRAVYLETLYTDYLAVWSECQVIYGHRDEARLSPEEKEVLADAVKKRKKVRTYLSLILVTCHRLVRLLTYAPILAIARLAQEPRSKARLDPEAVKLALRSWRLKEGWSIAPGAGDVLSRPLRQ